ncbi:MAG: hypothetical protein D6707_11335 [Bacteroidetes bacterium]|nr:MAG: hypothetical protein D6707_11335 [Bacteroidota bacterium]
MKTKNLRKSLTLFVFAYLCFSLGFYSRDAKAKNKPAADYNSSVSPCFTFAHISDIHFVDSGRLSTEKWKKASKGVRKFDKVPGMLEDFVKWVNLNNPSFVLMTGDILENYGHTKEALPEFFNFTDKLKMPYFITTGNHDFGVEKKIPKIRGGLDFYFTCGGVIFVGIPTFIPLYSAMVEIVPESALAAIVNISRKFPDNPVIVFTHAPICKGKRIPDWAPPYNAEQTIQVLEKCKNVIAVLAGHIHMFDFDIRRNIHYIVAPGFVESPDFGVSHRYTG